MKELLKIYKLKSEPSKPNMNQFLKNTKNLPTTWMISPKLTRLKYNNFRNNLKNKKIIMKNKSSHLIKKTQKILKNKKETLISQLFNSKITMKWKNKDFKRKYLKIEKSMSPVKKILCNKLKKKWESNKEFTHKRSIISGNKLKVFKINFQEYKTSIKWGSLLIKKILKMTENYLLADLKFYKKNIMTRLKNTTFWRIKQVRIELLLLKK